MKLHFHNRFLGELPGEEVADNRPRQVIGNCWSAVTPAPVRAPSLLAYSRDMARELDLSDDDFARSELVEALAGNRLLPGMVSYATCYGGHQFGHWAGQLGDGRAIYLGEVVNRAGSRWEIQLKGAGPTPYSRRADGRAVLRSSLREFLCSEAMHHLGVPTTRALSLIATGERVTRDMFYDGNSRDEPGAIVCRVAPSFVRFGHFEIFAARGEHALLQQLVDFTIDRDFPAIDGATKYADWFADVCRRTARLMVEWMRVGFVHGVMNTDNMSILGLTIDYGPYGWVDNFDPGWTPNTTDAEGRRYCYARQPTIARWNLERLGDALNRLLSAQQIEAALTQFDQTYADQIGATMAAKFGLQTLEQGDADLINEAFDLLYRGEMDMTEFFQRLADVDAVHPDLSVISGACYSGEIPSDVRDALEAWLRRYAARVRSDKRSARERAAAMRAVNPRFVLRNYLAQQAIERAEQGDTSMLLDLLEVLRRPYDAQPGRELYSAKRPEWARHKAGCSMLSCSS